MEKLQTKQFIIESGEHSGFSEKEKAKTMFLVICYIRKLQ